ncbi:replication initiation protein RepC [Epibacterium ulvae]|uniref:Replication initiation protein RepC n=1 Tax=Epibacterium ulvae TaxID=1156985 RepID=A0A1G5RHH1_9RHOB|nr:replication initiation protein RepC [Epibacterium ulvae]SCZ73535.1 replication initiation protein RepC [Epibacterium ulvae]
MNEQYYPALPQGWERSQVEALLIEIAPALKLGSKRLTALLYMMGRTKPKDWTSSSSEPVYFAPQTETALALGKTDRALRNDERALAKDHMLIDLRLKANGSRSFYGRCGIVFSRLIDMVPALIELRDSLRAERERVRELVQLRSTFLRHMKKRIEGASPELTNSTDFWAATQAFENWPHTSKLRGMAFKDLEAHIDDCRALCRHIDDLYEKCPDSSGRAEENFRSFIQEDINENNPVICNANIHKRTSGKPSDIKLSGSGPIGPEHCLEKKYEVDSEAIKSKFAQGLNPHQLYELASSTMRSRIEHHRGDRSMVRELDVIEAAHDMLPYLGINYHAWQEAVHHMTNLGAAICVLLLDANQDHPKNPVLKPGGALRGMTKRFRAGKLNVVGSLLGLSRRRGF